MRSLVADRARAQHPIVRIGLRIDTRDMSSAQLVPEAGSTSGFGAAASV